MGNDNRTVLITGFGPFGEHSVNASWVAVQNLKRRNLLPDVNVHIEEIPVDYQEVSQIVTELWEREDPLLMVHVGVSDFVNKITLEQRAHNTGYYLKDIKGKTPNKECCREEGEECICAGLDMSRVSAEINNADNELQAEVSYAKTGRYLCDFVYYISLSINKSRSAFIHVPPLNQPYTEDQLGEGVAVAISAMLKQLPK
ncbi:pyroglutamyl-peptidase 1-like isoform X1 [Saccostrea echinata]|uniref:pyroglutamyl-peptidase 1-like isoform X1 n=1 Tax=Saccostrea echinata TaxID=191078 RepID=UPI002A7EAB16|nr:pyroglutamyl-peptidase 1-like isoform X1 [Saccostrea echinata]